MIQPQIGARVTCRDGWAGTLKRLVVDPGTGAPTHLVIETASSADKTIVPTSHVLAIGYKAVFLDCSSAQLQAYCESRQAAIREIDSMVYLRATPSLEARLDDQ